MQCRRHLLANEKGIAMIGLIVLMTAGVLSYTAFTATSYVMMMNESKKQKREVMGFEAMQQIGMLLLIARQRHHNARVAGDTDCSASASPNTRQIGNFCFPAQNTGATGGACVDHPGDSSEEVCVLGDVVGSATPTVRIALRQKQPPGILETIDHWGRTANLWVGEKAFKVSQRLANEAPVAKALTRQLFFPTLGAVPNYTWTGGAVTCSDATNYSAAGLNPDITCMPCSEDGDNTGNVETASCLRLKVCLRDMNGFGTCAAGNTSHWFWQTVAVTAPVTLNPYP